MVVPIIINNLIISIGNFYKTVPIYYGRIFSFICFYKQNVYKQYKLKIFVLFTYFHSLYNILYIVVCSRNSHSANKYNTNFQMVEYFLKHILLYKQKMYQFICYARHFHVTLDECVILNSK